MIRADVGQQILKNQKALETQLSEERRDPAVMSALRWRRLCGVSANRRRDKFLERCYSYKGVPYAK